MKKYIPIIVLLISHFTFFVFLGYQKYSILTESVSSLEYQASDYESKITDLESEKSELEDRVEQLESQLLWR